MADLTCSVEDCERRVKARGWCSPHYERWRFHGDVGDSAIRRYGTKSCAVPGCNQERRAREWCMAHYKRWWKTGDANEARPVNKVGRPCRLPGCERRVNARGLCSAHYRKVKLYGITDQQIQALEAGHIDCEICGRQATDVDHCHLGGDTRGFLCNPCNRLLAAARDDVTVLKAAADYLARLTR